LLLLFNDERFINKWLFHTAMKNQIVHVEDGSLSEFTTGWEVVGEDK
jgi:hypothetical protein